MWREVNLWRGAILSPKVASSPLCAANPLGLVRVVFLVVSPGCFSGCVARLFSGCVARLFSGCVARLFSGCVARFVTDCVVRWFLAGFARACFPNVRQCVIAQDRARLNIEQVN